jgi:hypothetical protein|tara:strand:+ start:486 stop:767 length:282 start_codon:yes stop_codon:yes gene_type:complete
MRHLAIRNTHKTVVTIIGDTNATDEKGNKVVLDEDLITAEITRLQADYDAKEYQRKRASEYPSIAEQLDDLYHNGIDGWKSSIKAIKDKYPKG